jgi:hypothetical protein
MVPAFLKEVTSRGIELPVDLFRHEVEQRLTRR